MRVSLQSLVLAAALACSAVACGDEYDPEVDPARDPAGEGPVSGRTDAPTATVQVINQDPSITIVGLYMSRSSDESWGPELLEGRTIAPGKTVTLSNVPCRVSFDMRLLGTGNTKSEIRDMVFPCGETTPVRISR